MNGRRAPTSSPTGAPATHYLNATAKALRNAAQSRPARLPQRRRHSSRLLRGAVAGNFQPSARMGCAVCPARDDARCASGFADVVKADWPDAIVACVPNRGRDMAAFLQQARIAVDGGAELLCKVHTKRSTHRADGEQWRRDLYGKILGDRHAVRSIIQAFTENAALGIVAPEGHVVAGEYYWGSNADRVRSLAARIGYPGDPTPFVFAAGSMFWARSEALQPILDLGLETADFEEEEGQLDGTLAHALERLFPIAAKLGGYRLVDTRIVGKPTGRANELRSQRELAVFGDVGGNTLTPTSCRPVPPGSIDCAATARSRDASLTRDCLAPDARRIRSHPAAKAATLRRRCARAWLQSRREFAGRSAGVGYSAVAMGDTGPPARRGARRRVRSRRQSLPRSSRHRPPHGRCPKRRPVCPPAPSCAATARMACARCGT